MRARVLATLLTPLVLLLARAGSAFALNINENYKPQNEFKLDPWIRSTSAARPLDQQGRLLRHRRAASSRA